MRPLVMARGTRNSREVERTRWREEPLDHPERASVGPAGDDGWTLEELATVPVRDGAAGRGRALPLVIAAIAALVGFGFAGRLGDGGQGGADRPTAPSPAVFAVPAGAEGVERSTADVVGGLDFEIDAPSVGAAFGAEVPVRLRATPGSQVHVAVAIGKAVLGWTNPTAGPDGVVETTVRVYAPDVALPADVRVGGTDAGVSFAETRPVIIGGGGRVAVWSISPPVWSISPHGPGGARLWIDGYAPLTVRRVILEVLDPAGRTVGRVSAVSGVDPARAGSFGGRLLGIGSFRSLVTAHDGRPASVRVTWTDEADGMSGEFVVPIPAERPAGVRSPAT